LEERVLGKLILEIKWVPVPLKVTMKVMLKRPGYAGLLLPERKNRNAKRRPSANRRQLNRKLKKRPTARLWSKQRLRRPRKRQILKLRKMLQRRRRRKQTKKPRLKPIKRKLKR